MLTFDNVYQAPLDRMKTAADDWAAMKGKLDTLARDAQSTMAAKARDDYWRGVNAEVTKPFVDKTAKEFGDAALAAEGIHKVLEDGYQAFKKAKDDLKRIVETEAPAKGFKVTSAGKVEAVEPLSSTKDQGLRHDPDFQELVRKEHSDIAVMQQRIDAIVETCDDADVSCANALKADITADRHNFSAPKYTSLDAEEAQRAVDLAKKGREISHEELTRLNELLKDNSGSKDFSRAFYNGMGPRGALEFFGQLSTDTYDYAKVDKQRLADVQELQKNLGLNLATATQGGDAWTEKWSADMRKLGTERIPLAKYDNNPAYGYQLLGGIMRYGDYDKKFLVPIAEHVAQLHAKDPYLFANSKPMMAGGLQNQYNPSGVNGSGFDPMISMLEALGHSPEAAKDFFSKEPTAYNQDGSVGGTVDLDPKQEDDQTSYLDFFANKDYTFFADIEGHNPDDLTTTMGYMPDALGHALESATLGHAWDDPTPELKRDETTATIMRDVVDKYGGDAELLKKWQPTMADSLGNMGAGYIDDLNWALDGNKADSPFMPAKEQMSHPEFGREGAIGFLSTLGQHPDAYATLSTAERLHTTSVLEAQVGPDGNIDEGRARGAVFTGATLQGVLDGSRGAQVEAEGMKKHEEYEKAAATKAGWVGFGATVGVAAGVAFLPATAAVGTAAILVPLAVDTGSGAMEQLAGQVIGDWSDKSVEDHKDKTEGEIHESNKAMYTAGRYSAESPMERFLFEHRDRVSSEFRQDMIESVSTGYGQGNDQAKQTGNAPETG
ncbi:MULTISPECIES: DUF6571 family protein [Streptomyces]|uniref:AG2 protein n=1 Tax=Streptomyces nymphaeiformis TaxID=2663842 RepID=A0A7W7TTR6_9ACTN|nr:DUF6571 family protein [Streptomyces nymphaeiformis]MBB4979178.1 hypothetical protein [Streptomyces nymphaeiformis]